MKSLGITFLIALFFLAGTRDVMANATVRAVQAELQRTGFYSGEVDGIWGSQSAAAVRRFQLANDLRVTGELNEATLAGLGIRSTAVPRHKALADLFKGGPYLNAPPEFQVATVRKAKEKLKILGYYRGAINGDPSPDLNAALEAYQRSARFRATGRLDKTTLQALNLLTLADAAY